MNNPSNGKQRPQSTVLSAQMFHVMLWLILSICTNGIGNKKDRRCITAEGPMAKY